jgi:cytochrome P450
MTSTPPVGCPVSDYDPYAEENLLDPIAGNAALRDQGGVVWLSRYGIYALPRYATARAALSDWRTFSSAKGIMLNEPMNQLTQGVLLCSDPPIHDAKREVIMGPLTPSALKDVRDEITEEANAVVEQLCARGSFNAATDLAEHVPLAVVARRVGLPTFERTNMLRWSKASFECIGPMNARAEKYMPAMGEMVDFVTSNSARDQVTPGSWLARLYEAADAGKIPHEACGPMSMDYLGPSLDTTISALSSAMWLFANHPEQWTMLRERPSLIPNAINEVVRLESPIQGWSRYVTADVELEGVRIPADSRVLVMWGSANRDERKWDNPDAFDITRNASDHMGFGFGEHTCAGANLARLEIMSVLSALAKRVTRIELAGEAKRDFTQTTRGWSDVPVRVVSS